jgi:fatty acid desaturase
MRPWLLAVIRDWFVICVVLYLSTKTALVWPAAVFIIGTRQHSLAILGHEGAHRLICRNKTLNDVLACLFCWWPLGVGLQGYRKFHFGHHLHLGTSEDPERKSRYIMDGSQWNLPLSWREWVRVVLADLCGLKAIEVVRLVFLFPRIGVADWAGPIVFAVLLMVAAWHQYAVLLWYAAICSSFRLVFRLRVYTEHIGTDGTLQTTAPPLWKRLVYLPNNTWCHAEHHNNPNVPFSKLKKD